MFCPPAQSSFRGNRYLKYSRNDIATSYVKLLKESVSNSRAVTAAAKQNFVGNNECTDLDGPMPLPVMTSIKGNTLCDTMTILR